MLIGPSVNKEYLSKIQFYSMFSKLPVISNTVVIITVCVKVANAFIQEKCQNRTKTGKPVFMASKTENRF